ncbi:ABC transporter permease [Marinimicrobium alkaliphilum]|uniref:ABC transporter permease n=1 Tax=Marinimicrobium alkaliphilum TaxID=2202654 RepID=UPI000DB95183|nr:FtsX-like permease family protein [Marinimicrobium alkaliphilum]
MLALRLLWRNWRSGELKLLGLALVIAVGVVGAIALFTDRLERSLIQESNALLGADRVVRSSRPINPDWFPEAEARGLQQSQAVTFSSMVFAGEEMYLAGIKAVDERYPLRGNLVVNERAFAADGNVVAEGVPAPGEAWVDGRLLPLLDIALGDTVGVGEYELTVTRILVREPDGGNPFNAMGARLLMNLEDLERTEVIQPGSRVTYQWLLAADSDTVLRQGVEWLEEALGEHERIIDLRTAQQGLTNTLDTGQRFLLLAAVIGVLLAGVAIALSARQFAERHEDQVALMKSLGAGAGQVRRLYLTQLLVLATGASLIGLVLAEIAQRAIAWGIQSGFEVQLLAPGFYPYVFSLLTGVIALVCFALPALWFLPGVPPLKVLRRELEPNRLEASWQLFFAALAVVVLVALFSRDLALALSVLAALLVVLLITLGLALALLSLSRRIGASAGSIWRLAVASLQRRRAESLIQIAVFSVALMLLFTLLVVRTSMVAEWQATLPEGAPNHFLVNIPEHQVAPIQRLLDDENIERQPLYPMVRGRLTEINDNNARELDLEHNTLRREINLTWTDSLAEDNEIIEGLWWDDWQRSDADLPGVSVELDAATGLGLALGDRLRFSVGGLELRAEVASIRTLDWNSMRPNFYFIFEPGALDEFSPTYITSMYLPAEDKPFLNQLLRQYPTILVMELDRIIEQVQRVITQVSNAVQLVLWMTLFGGVLVLFAAVNGSLAARRQESALLRALGSRRQLILGSVFYEFAILGVLAGVIAIVGAEVLLMGLQLFVLEIPVRPHYWLWIAGPLAGAALVSGLGVAGCRSVVTTPPGKVLRELA